LPKRQKGGFCAAAAQKALCLGKGGERCPFLLLPLIWQAHLAAALASAVRPKGWRCLPALPIFAACRLFFRD
jgi:hypothetical protein